MERHVKTTLSVTGTYFLRDCGKDATISEFLTFKNMRYQFPLYDTTPWVLRRLLEILLFIKNI